MGTRIGINMCRTFFYKLDFNHINCKRPSNHEGLLHREERGIHMPSELQQVELAIPIDVIWDFIRDADNWAPLVPGYIQHEQLNSQLITWEFKSDLGIMKKKVSLLIKITEWNEPTRVDFELIRASNEKHLGGGYVEAKALNKEKTRVRAFLDINAKGPIGSLANSLFKSAIPKSTGEVAAAISSKLQEFKRK
jgi:carbon monoxide dehydrogenase subunit G